MTPALLVAAALAAGAQAVQLDSIRLEVTSSAPLAAPRIVEGSGAATSSLVPGVIWTHNDSGDGPFLYATDLEGRDLGRVRVEGAGAVDWEDLAAAPCLVVPGRCLYIGDIGDNQRRRSHVVVYRVREPQPPSGPSDTLRAVPVIDSIVLRYPDRPHDAEALVVTGSGILLVIAKDLFGPAVAFRASAATGSAARPLVSLGPLAMETSVLTGRLVTGAALSPGDSVLAVRTYVSLHFFRVRGDSLPAPLGTPKGVPIPVVEPQGEGVAFDGADHLILVSERGLTAQGTVTRLRVQAPWTARHTPTH